MSGSEGLQVVRDKNVIKPAPGRRQCNCRNKMVTKQVGPGMFQQYAMQVQTPLRSLAPDDVAQIQLLLHQEGLVLRPGAAFGCHSERAIKASSFAEPGMTVHAAWQALSGSASLLNWTAQYSISHNVQ